MVTPQFENLLLGQDLTDFETFVRLALQIGSSDIHFEPMPGELRIRTRIEGDLIEVVRLPHMGGASKPHPCIVQIKARSELQLQSRVPEDGRCDLVIDDASLCLRVSTVPQIWGEKLVIRIFDVSRISNLKALGFRDPNLKRLREITDRSTGMVVVTGPTGSGKTTTLYSILNFLNHPKKNIVTVEDPVEYFFYGINQIQVTPGGVTFESALRALMRQDPDIIMIGEIRDRATAEVAFHAAMTGHLVLTTVHAKDCSGALMRLLDIGIPPLLLSQAINGIVAQRLVPKLCSCATQEYREPLGEVPTHDAGGCEKCRKTGFVGRQGVQEIMTFSDPLRKMISLGTPEEEIRLLALKEGMETLKEDAIFKSVEGSISYRDAFGVTDEELTRITNDMPRLAAYVQL